jgi:hypothetical protein
MEVLTAYGLAGYPLGAKFYSSPENNASSAGEAQPMAWAARVDRNA